MPYCEDIHMEKTKREKRKKERKKRKKEKRVTGGLRKFFKR